MTIWTPEKIKQLRHRLGLTQTEFGARVGRSLRAVQSWEAGVRFPDGAAKILLGILSDGRILGKTLNTKSKAAVTH